MKQVTLIDENDKEIGVADLLEAHKKPGLLHRASSVFLFREYRGEIQLLLQKRSSLKIVGAQQWANTICGNVQPGETYQECAVRRLREELGLVLQTRLEELCVFRYQVDCNDLYAENERDVIWGAWWNGEVVMPNPEEVSQTEWVSWEKRRESPQTLGEITPWFQRMLQDEKVQTALESYINLKR